MSFDAPPSAPHAASPDGPVTVRWTTTAPAPPKPTPARHDTAAPSPAGNLLASLQRGIAAREYAATPNALGLQAPNRVHRFRTYFEPTGVRLVERTVACPREMVALRLARAGRPKRLVPTDPGRVAAHGARVELRRGAGLVEWYENSPRGLEQGFTFAARPEGQGPLVLDLAVTGARVRKAGDAITLESATGRSLRYADLSATDARGHALPARLAVCEGGVELSVDDTKATYPVTIDPLLTGTLDGQLGVAQANSGFGGNLASGGDVNGDGYEDLLVGSNSYDAGQTDEGAVFLFLGGPNGIPTFATPSATFQSDQFQGFLGFSLGSADVNGDGYTDVLCGAYGYSNGQAGEGAVFVFDGGPTIADGTPANASATLEVNLAGHSFGQSVAGAGDVNGDGYEDVIVGAPTGNGGPDAYIFLGGATGVATTPATTLSGTLSNTSFGFTVAGVGDINADGYADICVADPQYHNPESNEGGLYTWLGGPSGIASGSASTAQSILETNHTNWYLGYGALAPAGDVNGDGYADVVVGSLNWSNPESGEGAAIVLRGTATGFPTGNVTLATMATLEMNQASSGVQRVAAGDVNGDGYSDVVVGSSAYDFGASNTGAVAVYLGGWNGISSGGPANAYAFLHDGQAAEAFGYGLAVGDWNGDGFADLAVGAYGYDAGLANNGAVFLYNGGGRGIPTATQSGALSVFQANQDAAQLGRVAGAGDVNGDGYSDVIVGAPLYDAGETDEGAAFVIPGGPLGFPITGMAGATLLQSNQAGSGFGTSIDGAGDVNGDGYADVIVGSPAHDLGETDEGAAFVFLGSASGVANGDPSTAATTLQGNQAGIQFGTTVAGIGDVDGDGHVDVVVGTPLYDSGHGGVFVFHGAAAGIPSGDPSTAARTLESTLVNSGYGSALAAAGDVNGDGYADFIVGEPNATIQPGLTREGAAWIYQGSESGIHTFASTQLDGNENDSRFGCSVAGAGDVDGDGYDDVIVGVENAFTNDAGAAYVYRGGSAGLKSVVAGVVQGAQANAHLGTSVAGIGDIDGDGRADVAAGAWNTGSGSVYVQRGGPTGLVGSVSSTLTLNFSGAKLGAFLAGAGDVNGDGFADLVAGAPNWTNPQVFEGGAVLWSGGGNIITRASLVRQKRGDGSGISVQPWNGSHSGSAFVAGMTSADPMGRGRVQIEVETCPDGAPFGSGTCTHQVSGAWTDAGFGSANPGVPIEITKAVPTGGLYHWRTRTLRAPFSVTQPGISARPHPAAGPWRRNLGRSFDVDLHVGDLVVAVDRPGPTATFAIAPMGNPARGSIVLAATLPSAEPAEVALFDVAGRVLVTRSIPRFSGRQTVSLARAGELAAGVYFVRLTQAGRATSTHIVFLK